MTSAGDLFRPFHDAPRFPAGPGAELVYDPLTRTTHLLPAARLRALLACNGFATLDEHAARAAAQGAGTQPALRAEMTALAQAGLLVSAAALLDRIAIAAAAAPADAPPPVGWIGMATRNRGPDVIAALDGQMRNAATHGRRHAYVVAEGDVAEATRAATRASLAELGKRHGFSVYHAGFPERAAYAEALAARAGVPAEVTRFALLNPEGFAQDTGASRNAVLLHTIGDLHVQVDDDTRCRLAPAPGKLPGLVLTSQNYPSESWFPAAGEPALPDRVAEDACYVALHEELLGRSAASCAEAARRQGLDLERATSAFFRRLAPSGGRVTMTMTGCAGDTGTGSMWYYLLFSGPTRARLLASEATYRRAFTGRQAVRVVTRAAVSDGIFCMSMSLGLDGRGVLPPFLPVQRNSDGVFGLVTRLSCHGAYTGFLPWVIEHSPSTPRTTTFEAFFGSLRRSASEDQMIQLLASSGVEPDPSDPCRGMRALGALLERLGSLPPASLEEQVRLHGLRSRCLDLTSLEDALRRHRASPSFWARDVERTAAALRDALADPELTLPWDLVDTFGEAGSRPAMARMTRRYGELLGCWPEILEAARALRAEGVRPAVQVA